MEEFSSFSRSCGAHLQLSVTQLGAVENSSADSLQKSNKKTEENYSEIIKKEQ
jgi:hypothetical protein